MFSIPPFDDVKGRLQGQDTPIVERMKAIFYARHYGGEAAVEVLVDALSASPSVLFRHEIAYVLGQLGEVKALPALIRLLRDSEQHCMVRHEAAEALAALGNPESIELLEEYCTSSSGPLAETCQIGLQSLLRANPEYIPRVAEKWRDESTRLGDTTASNSQKVKFYLYDSVKHMSDENSHFTTVDPIMPTKEFSSKTVAELRNTLLDETKPLWTRYEALFALRNEGTPGAAMTIIEALQDQTSALFRHEVAFVLGQIQNPESVIPLIDRLKDEEEHPMARHEAALALGSVVGVENPEAVEILKVYSNHKDPIVAESCLVALDNIQMEKQLLSTVC